MTDPRLTNAAKLQLRPYDDEAAIEAVAAWRKDPENDEAWLAVAKTVEEAKALADHPDVVGLRLEALGYVMRERRRPTSWQIAVAAAACAILATPVALTVWPHTSVSPLQPTYQTDRGQRMAVALPDGSHLTLDTASRVNLAYSNSERRLILDRGQALFEVAKGQARPFVVVAGHREIVAHGTKFDVRLNPNSLQVALVEGKIVVGSGADQPGDIEMRPDDILTINGDRSSLEHVPGQATSLASWTNGDLNFVDARLADIAKEMNRYGPGSITIADRTVGNLRVSGVFRIGEPAPFIEVLKLGFPVQIEGEGTANIVVTTKRE